MRQTYIVFRHIHAHTSTAGRRRVWEARSENLVTKGETTTNGQALGMIAVITRGGKIRLCNWRERRVEQRYHVYHAVAGSAAPKPPDVRRSMYASINNTLTARSCSRCWPPPEEKQALLLPPLSNTDRGNCTFNITTYTVQSTLYKYLPPSLPRDVHVDHSRQGMLDAQFALSTALHSVRRSFCAAGPKTCV